MILQVGCEGLFQRNKNINELLGRMIKEARMFYELALKRELGSLNKSAYRKARERAGKVIPDILKTNVHSLRHSFGERLTESDIPWDWKQALLGHNPKEVTWRYSHYYKGMANMLKLLKFVEMLVKYSSLDEMQKMGRVA